MSEEAALFRPETFEFFEGLSANPTRAYYKAHEAEFTEHVAAPFRALMQGIIARLPASITDVMDTKKGLYARIPKNDFGRGGAWDFYWAALHPPGYSRIESPQLFVWMNREQVGMGFHTGDYGKEFIDRFIANVRTLAGALREDLAQSLSHSGLSFGAREGATTDDWRAWLEDPEAYGISVAVTIPKDRVLAMATEELIAIGVDTFRRLFPLVLLATEEDPLPQIRKHLGVEEPGTPSYPLNQLAADTGLEEGLLASWIRAIERHGQAILYGPPGTGKTYVAERLARHLVGGGDGFVDLVQFHPAYAYEDFIEGIRPQASEEGVLEFPMVPGRFMDFCRRAETRSGRCVLVIDEINRADLSRVFGELMYLLEYRDQAIPLAGGARFRIPKNVRLIGTMNTADRSIALVDHALRRRFAFLPLYPDHAVLRSYHEGSDFDPAGLIQILREVNEAIEDRHYHVGITFFLRKDAVAEIPEIWRTQIEPYLEEYFFDQPAKVEAFRWERIAERVL